MKNFDQIREGKANEVELNELTAAEKKLVDKMYDKKGNLTPFGKKVMGHKFPTNTSATQGKRMGEGKANEVELDERDAANALKRKTMDAARGARFKQQNPNMVPDRDKDHKTPQQHNKAIGRALRTMGEEIKEVDENKKMKSDALKRAMDAFKKSGGKVKIVAPGKAANYHGIDDLGTGMLGMLDKGDTKKFKAKRGGKIKSMGASVDHAAGLKDNYQVQQYKGNKKVGEPKSFGGNLKKATAHADKMGGDHRVHKAK